MSGLAHGCSLSGCKGSSKRGTYAITRRIKVFAVLVKQVVRPLKVLLTLASLLLTLLVKRAWLPRKHTR